jgi:3-phenylpropionate/trans-cinnamate dioxygenase ferredoxin subunit
MLASKNYTWYKIEEHFINWQINNLCVVTANHKKITLAKENEKIFAVAHKCPHASGIMADGFIDDLGNIVCPLHRYKFNMQTGVNTTGEGYHLKTYAVELREDGIYIGIEEKGLFGIF